MYKTKPLPTFPVVAMASSPIIFSFALTILLSRASHALIWPAGTAKVQVIVGFGVPVDLKVETVIFGTVFKANYNTPQNVSQLREPFLTYERRQKRAVSSRWQIYKMLEQLFEMRGFGGKNCVLRTICQLAQAPFHKSHGLFNKALHLLFTPSSTAEELDHYSDNEYHAAQKYGKTGERCELVFPGCYDHFLEEFSMIE